MVATLMLLKLLHCRKRMKATKNHCSNRDFAERFIKEEFPKITVKKESKENEDRTCRVCLKEGTIPIFGDETSENISEDLSTMASIEIDPVDEFPKYVCQQCNSLLQAAILLKKTAQLSDIKLRSVNVAGTTNSDYNQDDSLNDCDDPIYEPKEESEKNDNSFHCNKCDLDFKTFTEYNTHCMTKEHGTKKKLCPYCHKLFNVTFLKHHLSSHKPEISYMCDVCGKKFTVKQQFQRHRLTHFYILPYKCTLCPYRGRFAVSLRMHMRSHTGDKPYQCSECPSRFISKSNLNKHTLTHKREYDFKCETCGKGFYTKRDVELHFKVDHTGIKDHVCNICGKAFGYRQQMMKHQRKVHKREKLRSGRMPIYLQAEAKNIPLEDS